jgi:nicotinamide-nucleotide amidase
MSEVAVRVAELMQRKGATLATAESCTGGGIASSLTAVSGASEWYLGGWVTYSNQMKTHQLGVPEEMFEEHGAVSSQVAKAMCEGARKQSSASVSLSTTGIAGPTGGTDEKPVGTVYIGCSSENKTDVRRCLFTGTRTQIQTQAAEAALQFLLENIS